MSDATGRQPLYEEFLRRIAAALRGAQLYSRQHPLTTKTTDALLDTLIQIHSTQPTIAIGIVGDQLIVGDLPLPRTRESMADFIRRLQSKGIERIAIDKGVERDEIVTFIEIVAGTAAPRPDDHPAPSRSRDIVVSLPHIRAGKIKVERAAADSAPAAASLKRLYDDAVTVAEGVWDTAGTEGQPDLRAARSTVDTLADAVSQNRSALLGLTAMQRYDNYTFTHMVNVSILTMGQARALGIEGRLLREVGLSGLMHDIGKVRTPLEVLNKTEKLNDAEYAIMKRHTIEGAEILRQTPEMPALAPVVAFEHHMRPDGKGYPELATRSTLNLGTMLCAIADVYDAMRSQRVYQEASPTERILAVLKRNDGQQFDQHLVRRFVQLLGVYPPGNLVRLSSGEIAIVIRGNVSEPYHPRVLVLFDAGEHRLETPFSRDLWESQPDSSGMMSVVSPLDPAPYGIDPLTYL